MKTHLARTTGLAFFLIAPWVSAQAPVARLPRLLGIEPGLGPEPARWGRQGLLIDTFAADTTDPPPFDRFSATTLLGWTSTHLCAHVAVTDTTPFEADSLDNLHEADSVQLFLGTQAGTQAGMPARAGSDGESHSLVQLVVAPGRVPAHPEKRIHVLDYRSSPAAEKSPVVGRAAVAKHATGYIVEACLPFSVHAGLSASMGTRIGARVVIADGQQGRRTRLLQVADGASYDFWELPVFALDRAGAGAPTTAAWADFGERLDALHVIVAATHRLAGKAVHVQAGAQILAKDRLARVGERALARFRIPMATSTTAPGQIDVHVGGKRTHTLVLPDLKAAQKALFLSPGQEHMRFSRVPDWIVPHHTATVFSGTTFPTLSYSAPEAVANLVGDVHIEVLHYDATGALVTAAHRPGRYGAVATIGSASGASYTIYRTLFRRPDDGSMNVSTDAVAAAAGFESRTAGRSLDPEKADRDYWHRLRKARGDAITYEYFVRTPRDYALDDRRRWPLIVFLHGAGGGRDMEDVKNRNGPQAVARTREGFPFVVLSLRSPGGWYPPAVLDVLDAVLEKYRIDPDRVYLTGFSMGGAGTWQLLFDAPRRFAAAAPVGGRQGIPARAHELRHIPIWVINGATDSTTTPAEARRAVAALEAAGGNVRYTEIPGAGHVDSHDITYHGTELYDWFLKHVRVMR